VYTKNQCRIIAVVGSLILSMTVVLHIHADTILAEGKTKIIRQHDTDPALVFVQSKNDITAGNTIKHDVIAGKATWANTTTCNVFNLLQQCGIPVAFKKQCDATTFEADYCEMILYEVVIRREAHGSFLKRHPYLEKGHYFPQLIVEFFLKTTDQEWEGTAIPVNDPLTQISDDQLNLYLPAVPLHQQKPFMILDTFPLCNQRELFQEISAIAQQTFLILEKAWQLVGGRLVDLKIEFGFNKEGKLLLADVIDNDSWRVVYDGHYIDKQVYRDGADLETVAKLYANVAELTANFA
jgi:phosphoribosylaminoimidazole carboxylase/phosphoribosylaminoimidazole-succinocarboxamide synthase